MKIPTFSAQTEWVIPTEFPDLRQVDEIAIDLEIYPRLVSWEIYPKDHHAALYAFSNKDKLNKLIEDKHVFEQKE